MNMNNHMLSGVKKKNRNWLILMPSQDIRLLCPVISSRGDPVLASFKHIYYFQFLILEIIDFVVRFMYLMQLFLVC